MSSISVPLHGWKLISPLPDATGFGGMLAGVMNGRLFAAGGSQFADRPLWLQGQKIFSDRVFTLAGPDAGWNESTLRLPAPVASPASAATTDVIYYAGGLNSS